MARKPVKITKAVVDSLKPTGKDFHLPDAEVKGLYLRVYPSGRKAWVIRYRKDGGSRKMVLGDTTVLSAKQAKDKARKYG